MVAFVAPHGAPDTKFFDQGTFIDVRLLQFANAELAILDGLLPKITVVNPLQLANAELEMLPPLMSMVDSASSVHPSNALFEIVHLPLKINDVNFNLSHLLNAYEPISVSPAGNWVNAKLVHF